MNRREAERLTRQRDVLVSLGFTPDEAEALRRISMTLHRWHELECGDGNGCIERDEGTGRPYWLYADGVRSSSPLPDREAGAKRRLAGILQDRNARMLPLQSPDKLQAYVQGDPRGAALYILRPGDVPEGEDASAYYSRGVCVY